MDIFFAYPKRSKIKNFILGLGTRLNCPTGYKGDDMPKHGEINKILIIGSGPVVIGQGGELDQAGVQTCDALRSIGYQLVILHSDPAAVITDLAQENQVYIEPLDLSSLLQIIQIEKPDAVLATVGGQTALNLTADLLNKQTRFRPKIKLLGLSPLALSIGVDRTQLKALPLPNGINHSNFTCIDSTTDAVLNAEKFGYPILIRSVGSTPGQGNAIAYNIEELQSEVKTRLASPQNVKIILEESLIGYKEIEVLVVRDIEGHRVIWTTLENIDPIGIHHGDSVVTIPVRSLSSDILSHLEETSGKIADQLGVTGLISLRFAYLPETKRIVLINIIPRASRSTSLASLATRRSVHHTAALLVGGMRFNDIPWLSASGSTQKQLCVPKTVVRFPCWAFSAFSEVPDRLNVHMQSVGQVVGIGDTFGMAFQKAFHSTIVKGQDHEHLFCLESLNSSGHSNLSGLHSSQKYCYLYTALKMGETLSNLHQITQIDPFFLGEIKKLTEVEKELETYNQKEIDADLIVKAKSNGFSDVHLAMCLGRPVKEIQNRSKTLKITFQYLPQPIHFSHNNHSNRPPKKRKGVYLMIGPGPDELGHGLGYGHNGLQAAQAVKDLGYDLVRMTCNPSSATICRDLNETNYLEPFTIENLSAIYVKEKAQGVFAQFGGPQMACLAPKLCQADMNVIDLTMETISISNNYGRFRHLINEMGMAQPDYEIVQSKTHLLDAVERIGYPILIRPEARSIDTPDPIPLIITDAQMMARHFDQQKSAPLSDVLLVERFLEYAIECEVDALCDGKEVFIPTVLEHIELAGVHSADSACVTPPYSTPLRHIETICEYSCKIISRLKIKGLTNIRFAILNDTVYVLDLKPWASGTVPLTSKICNMPLAYIAAQILLGKTLSKFKLHPPLLPYFGIREAVFPFANFPQVDPLPGPRIQSTGSVLSLDNSFGLSYFKSQKAILSPLPLSGCVLITVTDADKPSILEPARKFKEMGFSIKATKGTQVFLEKYGISAKSVRKLGFGRPNLVDAIKNGDIDLIINTPSGKESQIDDAYIRKAAIECRVPNLTTPAGALAAAKGIAARLKGSPQVRSLKDYYALIR
jgi:carbamoyl-phosphate synthase large subunit